MSIMKITLSECLIQWLRCGDGLFLSTAHGSSPRIVASVQLTITFPATLSFQIPIVMNVPFASLRLQVDELLK